MSLFYLRPSFIWDSAFIRDLTFLRTQASEPWHLLETQNLFGAQHLIEVLQYVLYLHPALLSVSCSPNYRSALTLGLSWMSSVSYAIDLHYDKKLDSVSMMFCLSVQTISVYHNRTDWFNSHSHRGCGVGFTWTVNNCPCKPNPITVVVLQAWSPSPRDSRVFWTQYRSNTVKLIPIPTVVPWIPR